jgi:hypothetical protein
MKKQEQQLAQDDKHQIPLQDLLEGLNFALLTVQSIVPWPQTIDYHTTQNTILISN